MPRLTVNGKLIECEPGSTILHALLASKINIPHLCDDPLLDPIGACRLCQVHIQGAERPVTACNTPAADGMVIQTHTPEIEQTRRTLLGLLAASYPSAPVSAFPDKPFHRYLRQYDLQEACRGRRDPDLVDDSHPYIHVDMSQCIYCYRCVRACEEVQGQFVWRIHNRGDQTRILPDTGGNLMNSSCVGCGACVQTCPTGALEDQTVLANGHAMRWTRTTCPYCGVGCEMNVGVESGKIVTIQPAPHAPVNKGHLCIKGRYAFGFNDSSDRITRPMIKRSGKWETVSWGDAIQFTADRLRHIRDTTGPDSIGVLGSARATNEENYLTQKFARVVLGTHNVDCCARVCHAPSAAGMRKSLGTGAATSSFDDIERAGLILIVGANPTENHPVVGARMKQALMSGAKMIVIDPRRIELAELADIHMALRPGTNIPLINAIAHVIIKENLFDRSFIDGRVNEFDAFREFVADWTPQRAAEICGLDAQAIHRAAHLYATTKPAICFHGLGMTEHVQGTEGVSCLSNLALLTGNIGKPGTGMNPLRGQNNVQGAAHMGCEPRGLTGMTPIEQGRELFEKVWGAPLPKTKGMTMLKMIDAAEAGALKALWVIGYDIMLSNPDSPQTRRALAGLDLVILQDMFLNQVADFAHVFLPAVSSFEKDGTFMNSERRVQRVRKALDPPGEARADWRIIQDVASTMGHGHQFNFNSPREIWDEIRAVWPAGRGITYDRLDHAGLQWPCPDENHPGTPILHVDSFPTGPRAPLQCVDYRPTPEITDPQYPFLLTTGRRLYQFNAGTMTMRTPNTNYQSDDLLDICPEDAGQLNIRSGELVGIRSRHGQVNLKVRISSSVRPGLLFTTFHSPDIFINELTSPHRDNHTDTPEYKVVAVCIERHT